MIVCPSSPWRLLGQARPFGQRHCLSTHGAPYKSTLLHTSLRSAHSGNSFSLSCANKQILSSWIKRLIEAIIDRNSRKVVESAEIQVESRRKIWVRVTHLIRIGREGTRLEMITKLWLAGRLRSQWLYRCVIIKGWTCVALWDTANEINETIAQTRN